MITRISVNKYKISRPVIRMAKIEWFINGG